ncbi:MAG TPA: DNA-primase RepB domain-containing protein, partial [Bryobacteraceae bacterium]
HLSLCPLEPALATAVARHLARTYGGDLSSADWRHLGRLAGFTNQKPARRTLCGYPPWITILHARAGLASHADRLLRPTIPALTLAPPVSAPIRDDGPEDAGNALAPAAIPQHEAIRIYQSCMQQWHISERFPQPDWSIVDLWVARELLSRGTLPAQVRAILQGGSPQFPRRHGDAGDYLLRTLARAAFPALAQRARPV